MVVSIFASSYEALRIALDVQAGGAARLARLVQVALISVDHADGAIAKEKALVWLDYNAL